MCMADLKLTNVMRWRACFRTTLPYRVGQNHMYTVFLDRVSLAAMSHAHTLFTAIY